MNGRANEIRYSDERRLVTYSTRQPDTAVAARTAPPATEVYLGSGPDSNLRATGRIEIFLDAKSNTLNRMSARSNIRVVEGVHTVTGGANSTLEYGGATEQYVVKAAGPPPISVVKRESGNVTLFAFDAGQELSEHTAPYDALVQVLEGEAAITVAGHLHRVGGGEMLLLPAHQPHALKALSRFKMLLTMIRS